MFRRVVILLSGIYAVASAQVPDSGLSLWLRADKGVETINGRVLSWKDQSRNGNNALTTTDTAPLLIKNEVNGKPAIRFNGKNTGMQTRPFNSFPGKKGTVIIVARVNDSSFSSGGGYGTFVSTYFGKGLTWQMGATPYILYFYDGIGGSGFPYASISPHDWLLITLQKNKNTSIDFYRIDKYRTSFDVKDVQPDINPLKIGYNGGLEVLNGDIAEVMIYGRALSAAELSAVHGYLQRKYNIYWPAPSFYKSWWFYSIVIALALAMIIMATRYIAQRALKLKLKELERQRALDKERLRISREMHDDIGAGLTRITLMSEIARHSSDKKELAEIADASRKLVTNMNGIIWSLNPEHKTLGHLFSYLREELNNLLEPSGIDYRIELPLECAAYVLTNEQKRNILLVTKEIVHNAVKYSEAERLSVKAHIKEDVLWFSIEDNGKGFDTAKEFSGNGMKNIRYRLDELNAAFDMQSGPGKGVSCNYGIPLNSHSHSRLKK
jgi:signal transduction histidine kinase